MFPNYKQIKRNKKKHHHDFPHWRSKWTSHLAMWIPLSAQVSHSLPHNHETEWNEMFSMPWLIVLRLHAVWLHQPRGGYGVSYRVGMGWVLGASCSYIKEDKHSLPLLLRSALISSVPGASELNSSWVLLSSWVWLMHYLGYLWCFEAAVNNGWQKQRCVCVYDWVSYWVKKMKASNHVHLPGSV